MEKKIFQRKVNPKHYLADACVVWCFDDRFSDILNYFIKIKKWKHADVIKVAGGAKGLANPDNKIEKIYLLSQIEKSIKLHSPKEIALMLHQDCGAYRGKIFDFKKELAEAEKALRKIIKKFPKVKIKKYFVDFEGMIGVR